MENRQNEERAEKKRAVAIILCEGREVIKKQKG